MDADEKTAQICQLLDQISNLEKAVIAERDARYAAEKKCRDLLDVIDILLEWERKEGSDEVLEVRRGNV